LLFQETQLWRRAFEPQPVDSASEAGARQRLKSALLKARENACVILNEIPIHLPQYTVHDISHVDALWEYAELIAGPNYALNPVEAFVLGTAFLVHDAGMALPAIGGIEALKADTFVWRAHLREAYANLTGREAEESDLASPSDDTVRAAMSEMVREGHATQAENLVAQMWPWGGGSYALIEDAELREVLGPSIGRVAAFHGESIEMVDARFGKEARLGAPTSLPPAWTYDVLKIALMLRTADAAHIDDRRAPRLLAALRKPSGSSLPHWQFQSRLSRPILVERVNALRYESFRPFSQEEADAWWLAYDAFRIVDQELASADAVLRDRREETERFRARGVQNVKSPAQFAECLKVSGWRPVDASVRIEDPTKIVQRLGGEQLYGNDLSVPLRELLQNGVDAILARRLLEEDPDLGKIEVEVAPIAEGKWRLSVSDDGIGMDEEILTKFLLSFGKSFWSSPAARQKFPEIVGAGYRPTGKYGIGFFSIFMLGNHVRIVTKLCKAGLEDFRTLRFGDGLNSRPVLHVSGAAERPRRFSTRVSVDLDSQVAVGMLRSVEAYAHRLSERPFDEGILVVLQRLAAAFPVNLFLKTPTGEKQVLKANDWIDLDPKELFLRLNDPDNTSNREEYEWMFQAMRPVYLANDRTMSKPVGRFGLYPATYMLAAKIFTDNLHCAILAGPFPATRVTDLAGLIAGEATRAARDQSIVDVGKLDWEAWLRDQCDRMADGLRDKEFNHQAWTGHILLQLGGRPRRLQILASRSGPLTLNATGSWIDERTSFALHLIKNVPETAKIEADNVLFAEVRTTAWIAKAFKGISPQSLPAMILELCHERWGQARTKQEEISSGTWQYTKLRL